MSTTINIGESTVASTIKSGCYRSALERAIGDHVVVRTKDSCPSVAKSRELREQFRMVVEDESMRPVIRCTDEHSDGLLCIIHSMVTSPMITIVGTGALGDCFYCFQDSIALKAALEQAELIFDSKSDISFDQAMKLGIGISGIASVIIEIGKIE